MKTSIVGILFLAILLSGCVSSRTVKMYPGPEQPTSDLAMISTSGYRHEDLGGLLYVVKIRLEAVDGKPLPLLSLSSLALVEPGERSLQFECRYQRVHEKTMKPLSREVTLQVERNLKVEKGTFYVHKANQSGLFFDFRPSERLCDIETKPYEG